MEIEAPPVDYEALVRLIHERYDAMSRGQQAIALFLTQNPNDVAVQSVNALAERCGTHASSLVRFAQALGYAGFREVQVLFQRRLSTVAPGFEARVRALDEDFTRAGGRSEKGFLRALVVQDIAALQELVETVSEADLARAADLIAAADTVYLAGQLRSAPVVDLARYLLTMIGKRCVLLDPGGGLATHMARRMTPSDVLFAVSFRFYAQEVVAISEEAAEAGIPSVVITDTTLSPLAKTATALFPVPEHRQTFTRSLAAPICVAQAIVVATAARLPSAAGAPRIPTVTERAQRD